MKEHYQPTPEDITKAERAMTDEQKKLSRSHEEGFNLGRTIERDKHTPNQSYGESNTINGKEIVVTHTGIQYELYLPQLNNLPEARSKGIYDSTIPLSGSAMHAKKVFDFACCLAEDKSLSLYDLHRRVGDYSAELELEGFERNAA